MSPLKKPNHFVKFLLFSIIFSFLITLVSSQVYTDPDAKIKDLYVSPETSIIDQASEITIRVENIGKGIESFKVNLYVLRSGSIKLEKNFDIEVKPDEIWMEIEKFTPDLVGMYKIHVEIWDVSKLKLFDAKTIDIMARGEIGPFDATIDVITTYPYPGKEVFAIINLLNKGTKEEDVTVNYRIEGTAVSGKYMIAPEPESETSRVVSMPAPKEPGLYNLSVDVEYGGSIMASADGNFYVESKEYKPVLEVEGVPHVIELEQGKSKIFSIKVDNTGDSLAYSVHLIVRGISSKWIEVWPSSVDIMPGESNVYLANFNIPQTANAETYSLDFVAVGKENYKSEPSALTVFGPSLDEEEEALQIPINQILKVAGFIASITILIIIVCVERKKITFLKTKTPIETVKPTIHPNIRNLAFLDLHNEWRKEGLVIGLDFIDAEGGKLSFDNVKLDVAVSLFTTKTDPHTLSKEKDRIVHKGTVVIKSDSDLSIHTGGGILIPKEEIGVNPKRDEQYGILEVTVLTPARRGFFAKDEFVKLY